MNRCDSAEGVPRETSSQTILKHARPIALLVLALLEEHEVNQEASSQKNSLDGDVQIHGKRDAEVISVREVLC